MWQLYKPEIGINGFRKAGIFPFSREAIAVSSLNPSNAFTSTGNNTNDDNDDDCNDTNDTNTHDNGNDELHDEGNYTINNTNDDLDVHSPKSSDPPTVSLVDLLQEDNSQMIPAPTINNSHTTPQPSQSSTSSSLRDFFQDLSKTKITPTTKKRGKSVATRGESLTAEDALARQKAEERKQLRLQK